MERLIIISKRSEFDLKGDKDEDKDGVRQSRNEQTQQVH